MTTGKMELTRAQQILIGVVITGVVLVATIGFAGSYIAIRALAEAKGFGSLSILVPIGIDLGIISLVALDLLLRWLRMPFPLLRQTAWLLTAGTVAFNSAPSFPDVLAMAMHGVLPVLFLIVVEAARNAVGRLADITEGRHMESVRSIRWLLALPSTLRLWRRMKLWELRSISIVLELEQHRMIYKALLRTKYGRTWRRRSPVESLLPLSLARYGVPLIKTAPAGLAAAGINSPLLELSHPSEAEGVPAREKGYDRSESPAPLPNPEQPEVPRAEEKLEERVEESKTPVSPRLEMLKVVDPYYLAWASHLDAHGKEPGTEELSEALYGQGFTGLTGGHIAPATLRRYFVEFRCYRVLSQMIDAGRETTTQGLVDELHARGITGRHGKVIEATDVDRYLASFRRRSRTMNRDLSPAL